MDVDLQLKILKAIWRGTRGKYVFLPYIKKEYARTKERKQHWREGPAFRVGDWATIRAHLIRHRNDDLYFTPMVFTGPRRSRDLAGRSRRLWADLDEANPHELPEELKPSVVWETSRGRYAAVWFMAAMRSETTERGGENHKLTIAVGADPSGWDTTQLLRVPGSVNNKPEYKRPIRGRLVWSDGGQRTWDVIDDLPEIPEADIAGGDLIDEQLLEAIDPYETYARIRTRLRGVVRQYMRLKDDSGLDRSEIAWQCERELADAGCSLLEMVAIMRPTPWNKYAGRSDELKRLTLECGKALALKKERKKSALDTDEEIKHKLVPFWNDESYLAAPDPEWLYDEFIPKGGCGFIAGIPKSLKTWLAMDLAICAAMGVTYLGYKLEKPINVLYVQREDPTTLVRSRHHVIASTKHPKWALSDKPREVRQYPGALYVETKAAIELNDEGWLVWLAESIRGAELDLVIFDTLVRSAPGVDIDSATSATTEVLNPIKSIARDLDCAMVFVHHNTKSQGNERAGQNMVGSGQIHAWADFGIYVKKKTEGPGWVNINFDHETKYTGTRDMTFRIEGLEEDPQQYRPIEWVESERKTKRKENPSFDDLEGAKEPAVMRVKRFFRHNPASTIAEAAAELNLGERTVRRYKPKT